MKDKKATGGFSLIEVVVAITVLGVALGPLLGTLTMAHRLNAHSAALLRDQLAVTRTVETLMAEGLPADAAADPAGVTRNGAPADGGCAVTVEQGAVRVETWLPLRTGGGS